MEHNGTDRNKAEQHGTRWNKNCGSIYAVSSGDGGKSAVAGNPYLTEKTEPVGKGVKSGL